MNEQIMKSWAEQVEKMTQGFGPARDAAKFGVDTLEKMISAQLESARAYSELAVTEARAALEVKDPKDLQSYIERQRQLVETINSRVKNDAEKAVSLNQDFAAKIRELAEANIAAATKASKA
ncbi:phasin family protein [Alkalilimnicola sp. S0819]|uniref:phasin family protein n=1 Tax=Alkalilimnicola sp. S0819 TaxID=2613922 RepID=UPI0012616D61|nr:phasin family protein [Alkalilimnicola sp. S0819]KAB7627812.1 phasin family protein [Alkalilimnicola sp. S0819]MPQ15443.1 phasin family protein [Alkalilimnicola sp. S0819]